jgi:prepilin-type processing-associated H-X9-DG protein
MSWSHGSSFADRKSLSGLTRLDLLAIILVIGLLIALLLPAILEMHGHDGRNQCMNNLKQLALAALNHEASKKFLPTGGWGHDWIGDPDAGLGENQPGGWAYSCMFFMEGNAQISQISGQPWAKKVALGATIEGAGPNTGMGSNAVQPMFYCPTRRWPGLYPGGVPAINSRPFFSPNLIAKTDYAANGGTIGFLPVVEHGNRGPNDISTTDPIGDSETDAVAALPTIDHSWYLAPFEAPARPGAKAIQPSAAPEGTAFTGVCWYRSRVGLDCPDGTSKVYLFGEKYLDKNNYTAANAGSGDEESVYRGMSPANIRLAASAGIDTPTVAPAQSDGRGGAPVDRFGAFLFPPLQDGSTPPGTASAVVAGAKVDWFSSVRFGSAHPGSFNMAFCDGSVHCIAYDIDPRLHAMLSDRADGHRVDPKASFEY